jgi:ethanolamine utilization protein EutP (predicted NTPase)
MCNCTRDEGWPLGLAARWKVFLTVHGVDGDDTTGQPELADKTLDGRNLIGLVVDLDMAKDERVFDIESTHQVGRLAGQEDNQDYAGKIVSAARPS